MIHSVLTEFIDPEMEISTPFLALLGLVPIQVFAVLEKTAVIQIIGQDDRKVVRHDVIFIDEEKGEKWKIRKRPADVLKQALKEARDRGRANRLRMDGYL